MRGLLHTAYSRQKIMVTICIAIDIWIFKNFGFFQRINWPILVAHWVCFRE